jgi:hypothetical protein
VCCPRRGTHPDRSAPTPRLAVVTYPLAPGTTYLSPAPRKYLLHLHSPFCIDLSSTGCPCFTLPPPAAKVAVPTRLRPSEQLPKDLLPRAKPESTNPSTAVSCYSSSSAAERPTMDRPLRPTSVPTDAPRAPSLPLAPRWPHQPRGQAPSQPLTSAPLRPPPATVEHRQW